MCGVMHVSAMPCHAMPWLSSIKTCIKLKEQPTLLSIWNSQYRICSIWNSNRSESNRSSKSSNPGSSSGLVCRPRHKCSDCGSCRLHWSGVIINFELFADYRFGLRCWKLEMRRWKMRLQSLGVWLFSLWLYDVQSTTCNLQCLIVQCRVRALLTWSATYS